MSIHEAKVVRIGPIQKHPNADKLGIVFVDDFQVVVGLDDWREGDLAVYVQPDTILPDRPEYEFLGEKKRVSARRFRKEWSVGMFVKPPTNAVLGQDVYEELGFSHYEPPINIQFSRNTEGVVVRDDAEPPNGHFPEYDVENIRKFPDVFQEGELVSVCEKIDGSSFRAVYCDGEFHVGTHYRWVNENHSFWSILENTPLFKRFLKEFPGFCVYGEVYGWVSKLRYGHKQGEYSLALFDIWDSWGNGRFLDFLLFNNLCERYNLETVPLIFYGPFNKERVYYSSEGNSLVLHDNVQNIREGVVVRSLFERTHPDLYGTLRGRKQLKCVSNAYLEQKPLKL